MSASVLATAATPAECVAVYLLRKSMTCAKSFARESSSPESSDAAGVSPLWESDSSCRGEAALRQKDGFSETRRKASTSATS